MGPEEQGAVCSIGGNMRHIVIEDTQMIIIFGGLLTLNKIYYVMLR
jgi:hypothetical protein